MKTAHQRGDHAAVTRALLLLHVIVIDEESEKSENPEESESANGDGRGRGREVSGTISKSSFSAMNRATLRVAAEEVLQRCLNRCAYLNLRTLSTQAALLLAKLRTNGTLSSKFEDKNKDGNNENKAPGESVQNLWRLIAASMLGDINITAKIASSEMSSELENNSAFATKNNKLPAEVVAGSDFPMSIEEHATFCAQAAILSMDVWRRLGSPEMAELQGRRALRQLGIHACNEDIVNITTKLAQLRADISFKLLTVSERKAGCLEALSIIKQLQDMYPAQLPASTPDKLHAAMLYIVTYIALIDEDYDRALRLAVRLLDSAAVTNESGFSNEKIRSKYFTSSAMKNNAGAGGLMTIEQAQSCIIFARVLSHFDKEEACSILLYVEEEALHAGLIQFVTEAKMLQAQFIDADICDTSEAPTHYTLTKKMDALVSHYTATKLAVDSCSSGANSEVNYSSSMFDTKNNNIELDKDLFHQMEIKFA